MPPARRGSWAQPVWGPQPSRLMLWNLGLAVSPSGFGSAWLWLWRGCGALEKQPLWAGASRLSWALRPRTGLRSATELVGEVAGLAKALCVWGGVVGREAGQLACTCGAPAEPLPHASIWPGTGSRAGSQTVLGGQLWGQDLTSHRAQRARAPDRAHVRELQRSRPSDTRARRHGAGPARA